MNGYNYVNPDIPTTSGFEYLQNPMMQQAQQPTGSYWNGQQMVNPFGNTNEGMGFDSRRNLAQQPTQNTYGGGMQPQQPMMGYGQTSAFNPPQQYGIPPMMSGNMGNGQLPNNSQNQPLMFGNGTGTYGVEGQIRNTQQPMGFNQMTESRRAYAQQPAFDNQTRITNAMYQQPMMGMNSGMGALYQQPLRPMPQNIPNWSSMNPYTQPQTPPSPVPNFQNQQQQQQQPQQYYAQQYDPQVQFPSVAPNWMDMLRANWNY